MKTCSRCHKLLDESLFCKNKSNKNGLASCCKQCYKTEYVEPNKERLRQYNHERYLQLRETIREQRKKYTREHKEQARNRYSRWRDQHKEHLKEYHRKWREQHKDMRSLVYFKRRLRSFITCGLRSRKIAKHPTSIAMFGCSYEEFIERVGIPASNSDHLDHICPLAQAQTEQEAIALYHYSNLRWISAHDNIQKCDSWTQKGEELCKLLLGRDWIHDTTTSVKGTNHE